VSGAFLRANIWKAVRMLAAGNAGLLAAMLRYRIWWWLRGLDLGIMPVSVLGLDPIHASYHKNGGGPQLERVLDRLGLGQDDVALDLGAGKGGAMITMARFPFARIDGVELAPTLVEIARANFKKLRLHQCHTILRDAGAFAELDDYTVLFMFHAFSDVVLGRLLANLLASLDRRPRRVRVVYSNPEDEALILGTGRFERVLDYHPYREFRICVYETTPVLAVS
jgi:hypothetical protein